MVEQFALSGGQDDWEKIAKLVGRRFRGLRTGRRDRWTGVLALLCAAFQEAGIFRIRENRSRLLRQLPGVQSVQQA
ncbi:MAG: hypothetical protein DWQ34_26435 [Planctomycetota bacterium]|nr:MAG: hypothetical protein DWQ29_16560 [Planctomycetota bacterium]REJ86823.1 MAG: hypothetical protein DWQ34_26435 [Planctomycetota bacterium]REK22763.1 MAG: hypothetical protein DWQ41_18340 [Planctomycetota bacterium]